MDAVLSTAVQAVARERDIGFKDAFHAARSLVVAYGEAGLAERVVSEVSPSVPWEVVADLLGLLMWSTADNGTAIRRAAERWLTEGRDLRKVQIALNLEGYPFKDRQEMKTTLIRLAITMPEVAARCLNLIEQRQAAPRA